LAVLVRNPSLYNPRRQPELTLDRRNEVIGQMADEGWISEAQADRARRQPLGVIDSPLRRGQADHVVAEVKRQLLNDPDFAFLGDTSEERKKAVFGCPADDAACEGGGGLQVFTTINLGLQKKANAVLASWLPLPPYEDNVNDCYALAKKEPGLFQVDDLDTFIATYAETHSCSPTGAMTMVDNDTGAVKVMASGLPFEFSQFDLAVQGKRNPGSSFKPFALVAALEQGYTMGHRWNGASPAEIVCQYPCAPDGSNIWRPENAGGGSAGVISLAEATYRSVNTVYAQVSQAVGPDNIVDVAKRMGVNQSALNPVLSIPLGSSAVTTLEMASAYSNFATNGLHAEAHLIERIVDAEGNIVYEHEDEKEQVSDPAIFAAARSALEVVPISGTAPRANLEPLLGFKVAQGGKTGTHQSYLDAWFVGFTPQYSTAVWVGYEAQQVPLEDVVINGQAYSRVFGGSVPAPIWAEFMAFVQKDLPVTSFPDDPENIDKYLIPPKTTVPSVVGLEVEEAKARLADSLLNVTVEEIASLEPEGIVINQSHSPGSSVTQGGFITIFVSTGETPVGTLPDLVGLSIENAVAALTEFEEATGVSVSWIQEKVDVNNPNRVGKVLSTNPEGGTEVEGSVQIVLTVGQ
jgi:penicillin-binding protein 1A